MSVLRIACYRDVPWNDTRMIEQGRYQDPRDPRRTTVVNVVDPLRDLYDAEWQRRGFRRSP